MTGLQPYFGQQPKVKLCLHQALLLSATASPVPERSDSPQSTMQYIRKVTNDDAASIDAGHRCFHSQQHYCCLVKVNIGTADSNLDTDGQRHHLRTPSLCTFCAFWA